MQLTRRNALRFSAAGGVGAALGVPSASAFADSPTRRKASTPAEALKTLKAGNERWRRIASTHPHEGLRRRRETLTAQNPIAIILGCSDSRVAPELVFDQGIGDLFDIRSAGQVLDESVLGSITYGVAHLHIPLIVVLGHASCGAVTAAVEAHENDEVPGGHVGYLVKGILPVIDSLPGGEEDLVDAGVTANAEYIAEKLRTDSELGAFVSAGRLKVVAGRYELDTYKVGLLD